MRVGYARISTTEQSLERQTQPLVAAGCEKVYTETPSAKSFDRPVLQQLLTDLQPGDVLVVHELDRLGRSMLQMLQCVENLLTRDIGLITLDGRLNTEATDPMIVKLIVGILGYAAEVERNTILKRTREGRELARANGVRFGRKRTWTPALASTVQLMHNNGLGYGTIAKALNISTSKVQRIMRTLKADTLIQEQES